MVTLESYLAAFSFSLKSHVEKCYNTYGTWKGVIFKWQHIPSMPRKGLI